MRLDKTHFNIKHRNLAHMPRGGAGFCAECWTYFKDSLKSTDHNLFIKLRTLRQSCFFTKIIKLKNFCSALCGTRKNFWRLDFHEFVFMQEFPDVTIESASDFKNFSLINISHSYDSVFKKRV